MSFDEYQPGWEALKKRGMGVVYVPIPRHQGKRPMFPTLQENTTEAMLWLYVTITNPNKRSPHAP